jgi:hypothetical protein
VGEPPQTGDGVAAERGANLVSWVDVHGIRSDLSAHDSQEKFGARVAVPRYRPLLALARPRVATLTVAPRRRNGYGKHTDYRHQAPIGLEPSWPICSSSRERTAPRCRRLGGGRRAGLDICDVIGSLTAASPFGGHILKSIREVG